MSQQHFAATRARAPRQEPLSLPLRLVAPMRSRARRAPFVVVVLTVLTCGLVGLIVMSTVLQAQSFQISQLQQDTAQLQTQQQQLDREVERLQAPAHVARQALLLGMVPNANPAFLRLADGSVVGKPAPAEPRSNVRRVDP